MTRFLAAAALAGLLLACAPPAQQAAETTETAAEAAPVQVLAPAGTYALDPTHASLLFKVNHLGLTDYVARFTRYTGTLTFDPANLAASTIAFTVDPSSVRTDYPGNYRQTHAQSGFQSWDEDLSRSANFFNTGQFPEASFRSTAVEVTGANTARVTGDLTFLGQTRPVTFEVTYGGSMAQHPYTRAGAIGFTARGTFNRSEFGSRFGLAQGDQPGFLGDAVTIEFAGEFQQQAAPAAAAAPAEAAKQ
jgi:polyisoprenoid-binding protein YceI